MDTMTKAGGFLICLLVVVLAFIYGRRLHLRSRPLEECRELVARLHEPGGQALDEQELRDALVSALERPTTQSQLRVGVRRLL